MPTSTNPMVSRNPVHPNAFAPTNPTIAPMGEEMNGDFTLFPLVVIVEDLDATILSHRVTPQCLLSAFSPADNPVEKRHSLSGVCCSFLKMAAMRCCCLTHETPTMERTINEMPKTNPGNVTQRTK